jgi:hypothetical protein
MQAMFWDLRPTLQIAVGDYAVILIVHRLQMEEQSLLKVKQEQELLIAKLSDSSSGAAF